MAERASRASFLGIVDESKEWCLGHVQVSEAAVRRLPGDASLVAVERTVADAIRRACKDFNQRRPDVIVIAHEMDPR